MNCTVSGIIQIVGWCIALHCKTTTFYSILSSLFHYSLHPCSPLLTLVLPPGLTAQQLGIWDGCCLSGEELEQDHDHDRAASIAKVGLFEAVVWSTFAWSGATVLLQLGCSWHEQGRGGGDDKSVVVCSSVLECSQQVCCSGSSVLECSQQVCCSVLLSTGM